METSWGVLVLPGLLSLALMFLPGLALGALLRIRGVELVASAPLFSILAIALPPIVLDRLGVPFSVVSMLAAFAVSAVVAGLLGFVRVGRGRPSWMPSGSPLWAVAGTAIAAGVHVVRTAKAVETPDAVPQEADSPFHANVIRAILDTGNGSSIGGAAPVNQSHSFYPLGWHDLGALTSLGTGATPTHSELAMIMAISAVVWPVGCAVLVAVVSGSWRTAGIAALLAMSLSQMPMTLVWWGSLLPNFLAYMLLPYLLALTVLVLRKTGGFERFRLCVSVVVGCMAVAMCHPNTVFSYFVLVVPFLLVLGWAAGSAISRRIGWWEPVGGVAGSLMAVGFIVLVERMTLVIPNLRHMRLLEKPFWQPTESGPDILKRAVVVLFGWEWQHPDRSGWSPGGTDFAFYLTLALLALGAIWALRTRWTSWIPFAFAITFVLYLIAYVGPFPMRQYITGLWFADVFRLLALVGIVAVPLLALAVEALGTMAGALVGRVVGRGAAGTTTVVLVVVAASVFAVLQTGRLGLVYKNMNQSFRFDTSAPEYWGLVSEDEFELMERIPEHVPEGETIVDHPWDGSVYLPAIGDRQVLFPHLVPPADPELDYLAKNLNRANDDPRVCEIVRERDLNYVVDFGDDYLVGRNPDGTYTWHVLEYMGLKGLKDNGVAQVVDRQGDAELLKITACTP